MRKITYNEKVYNIPTDWNEITIRQHLAAEDLAKELGKELEFMAIVSAYTDIPIGLIKKGMTQEMHEIMQSLEFLTQDYKPNPITKFLFKKEEYFIEPYLVNNQFQDWLTVQTILTNNEENPMHGIARVIAVIAKKKDETLDDFNLDEREELFKDLPMDIVKDIESFFLLNYQKSKMNMLLSSKEFQSDYLLLKLSELRVLLKRQKRLHGRFSPTRWLIGIFMFYISLKEKALVKSFNSTQSNKFTITFNKRWWNWIMRLLKRKPKNN